jgi:hypothetical protein
MGFPERLLFDVFSASSRILSDVNIPVHSILAAPGAIAHQPMAVRLAVRYGSTLFADNRIISMTVHYVKNKFDSFKGKFFASPIGWSYHDASGPARTFNSVSSMRSTLGVKIIMVDPSASFAPI